MNEPTNQRLPARLLWPPATFLIFGLLITLGATLTVIETNRSRNALRFANLVTETRSAINERVGVYISLLRGVAGLYASGAEVDQEAFRRYVERLDLRGSYPGIQGVGFTARVRPAELEAFLAGRGAEGQPNFQIWPEAPRDEYFAITYLEPLDERNRAALGFDMYTEATRRAAMALARDSGGPAASGRVTLVQELADERRQAGFLIYVPIYAGGDTPPTLSERRERLIGFAYSPFRADDLFAGIFGAHSHSRVAFAIYDGARASPEALLHRSANQPAPGYTPALTQAETITVAGRPWTIVYSSQPAFDATGDSYVPPLAAGAGTLLTLILVTVAWGQAQARHEAEQAVRARENFLSVASHELKTPLTALYGNAQLLQRRLRRTDQVGERERANINLVVEQSRRLSRLIDDLLDHTRLHEGRMPFDRAPLNLTDLVARVAGDTQPNLARHTLQVSLPAEPILVLGDVARLDQVLGNLISNAVKYSPQGGVIEVALSRAEQWAVVRVKDQGIGIPDAALPRLFNQFYRAPNALSKHISGMGIGLYVVKEIVERHGGRISVESTEGAGSTFSVRLPLAEIRPPFNAPPHQPDPPVPLRP